MRKVGRFLLVTLTLALYFIVLAPVGYAALTVLSVLPTSNPDARARRLRRIVCWGFRTMHDWLRLVGLLDFNPRDVEGELPEGPCVVVANHRTLTDITSIMAAFGPMTAVAKPEIYRMWWLRPLIRAAGFVEGPSVDRLDVGKVVDSAVENVRSGSRFLIFPEGTRAADDRLLPFGRMAFEVARRARVPVAPILLSWKNPWLAKDCRLFGFPKGRTELRLKVLPPVIPDVSQGSSRPLRDMVETSFRAHLKVDSVRNLEDFDAGLNRESPQAAHR